MINFKCKSDKRRSERNHKDSLCIIKYKDRIEKCFACIISEKKSATLLSIIQRIVVPGLIIHTDEHKSYNRLSSLGYIHRTVCHKKGFINKNNGVNTQEVKSFNNYLKYFIKKKKGVEVGRREDFLIEFIWKFNNREGILEALF